MSDEFDEQARSICETWLIENKQSKELPRWIYGFGEEVPENPALLDRIAAALRKLGQERDDYKQDMCSYRNRLGVAQDERDELKAESIGHIQLIAAQAKEIDKLKARLDIAESALLKIDETKAVYEIKHIVANTLAKIKGEK